jgi:hypothetical protein
MKLIRPKNKTVVSDESVFIVTKYSKFSNCKNRNGVITSPYLDGTSQYEAWEEKFGEFPWANCEINVSFACGESKIQRQRVPETAVTIYISRRYQNPKFHSLNFTNVQCLASYAVNYFGNIFRGRSKIIYVKALISTISHPYGDD